MASMNTCVVALPGIYFLDNYKIVPPRFTTVLDGEAWQFIIHHDPECRMYHGHKVTNYDMLIQLDHNTNYIDADYCFRRYNKIDQMYMLNDIAVKLKPDNFILPELLCTVSDPVKAYHFTRLPKRVLLKSVDGARGLGHIVVDTAKVNIGELVHRIKNGSPESDGIADRIEQVSEALTYFKDGIIVHNGEPNYSNEILQTLADQPLMVTSIIEDVSDEFRVLINHKGKATFVKHRVRTNKAAGDVESDYLQATGANRDNKSVYNTLNDIIRDFPQYEVHIPEIKEFIKRLPIMNSVDLFFTKTGKWGIFEFCPQFGMVAYEPEDMVRFHMEFIVDLWKKKMKQ